MSPAVQPPDARTEVEQSQAVTFPALDTMRAVGSIAVVATHASFWTGAYTTHGIWGTALSRLDVGVAIFFVLSGFLLARPFIERSYKKLNHPPLGRYLWKRALRILPVYLVAASAALVLLSENNGASWVLWLRTLTLTDLYFSSQLPAGITQMWSLSTEVAFYAVLPLIMFIGLGRGGGRHKERRLVALLLLLVAFNVWWVLDLSTRIGGGDRLTLQWLPSHLSWFGIGIGLALAHVLITRAGGDTHRGADWVRQLGRAPGACWTAALALFAVASTPIVGPSLLVAPTLGEAATKNVLYGAIAGLMILPGIFADADGYYIHALSWKPLRHIGHISYSIFCIHVIVLDFVMQWAGYSLFDGHTVQIFVITATISIALSEVLYRFVERPFMSLKNLNLRSSNPDKATNARLTRTRH